MATVFNITPHYTLLYLKRYAGKGTNLY